MSTETGKAPRARAAETSAPLQTRRESLKQIGKFAAATAPAMLVLLGARPGEACPEVDVPGNGHAYGKGKGRGSRV